MTARITCTLLLFLLGSCPALALPILDTGHSRWLAARIYLNECNARSACLTSWNSGEDFPSLGIGHFIWYRQNQVAPFEESFPGLVRFIRSRNPELALPALIAAEEPEAPWPDRDSFLAASDSQAMQSLRDFLADTQQLQVEYIIQRFNDALPALTSSADAVERVELSRRVEAVAAINPPQGLYALIDYVHFKGTGLSPAERYHGQGWGLRQVLENMDPQENPLDGFVASAKQILENRVSNAPAQRNEQRWLQGWLKRLETYREAPVLP